MSTHVTKNIFWLTASRIAALVLLFVAYTQLFRYLGPFKSGQYQFVLSYVMLFSTFVDFGLQQFVIKKISEEPHRLKTFFQSFFAFETAVAAVLFVALMVIAYARHFDAVVLMAVGVAGLGMAANALCYPFLAVMSAYQDLRKVAIINFINSLVNITVIFLTILFHRDIVFLASVQLVFGLVDLVLYRQFTKKYIEHPEIGQAVRRLDFSLIKNIIVTAWPFVLLVGFSSIYNRIDIVLITKLKGYTDVGYYTAAYKVYDLLGFFPSVVSYSLYPFFNALMAQRAIADIRMNLEKYLKLMAAAALPMAVGGMILSDKLIGLVAGPQYAPAAPVLAILIWAPAILFMYIPANSLVISQLTRQAVMITGTNVIVNIAGNLALIPHYGIKAAAVMTVISEGLQGFFYFYFIRKNITDFKYLELIYKPLLASAAMGVAVWYVRNANVAVSIATGVAVYGLVLLATRFFTKSDIAAAKKMFASTAS